jgi:hypothetical protein
LETIEGTPALVCVEAESTNGVDSSIRKPIPVKVIPQSQPVKFFAENPENIPFENEGFMQTREKLQRANEDSSRRRPSQNS